MSSTPLHEPSRGTATLGPVCISEGCGPA
jgi:hypothetical protein